MVDFNKFGLHAEVLRGITDLQFAQPTPIQHDAIPHALAGRDLLACASTGSGKTAAFLVPIIERLRKQPRAGTRALVMTPTRELAGQIVDHATALARHTAIRAAAVFGGVGMKPQEQALRRGVDIVIATPGRLLDHMQYDYVNFARLEVLVLDEADRMLDMGFLPDIRRVLSGLPAARARQTLFFSATMPAPIVALSRELLKQPARLNVERKSMPASSVAQALYPVRQKLKADLLIELLHRDEIGNAIVFARTKHRADRLYQKIERAGIPVARIHGNRSQAQRTEALAGFKSARYRVLVATDIVARGIDVEALDHVVNFDVPNTPDDYIHRVGRTGRAAATGDAFTLVSPEEEPLITSIERATGSRIARRTVRDFDYSRQTADQLEVPMADRIASIRETRRLERERAAARARGEIAPRRRQPHRRRRQTRGSDGSPRRAAQS